MSAPPGAAGHEHHTGAQWGKRVREFKCMPVTSQPAAPPPARDRGELGRAARRRQADARSGRAPHVGARTSLLGACAATLGALAKHAMPHRRCRLVPVCNLERHFVPATPICNSHQFWQTICRTLVSALPPFACCACIRRQAFLARC